MFKDEKREEQPHVSTRLWFWKSAAEMTSRNIQTASAPHLKLISRQL